MTHRWSVGDLCTATYKNVGEGIIYRVIEVSTVNPLNPSWPNSTVLKLKPIFGVIADVERRRTRELGAGWCTPLSLVDLGVRYMEFGTFIREEALRRAGQPETTQQTRDGEAPGDASTGYGVCADFSARTEDW